MCVAWLLQWWSGARSLALTGAHQSSAGLGGCDWVVGRRCSRRLTLLVGLVLFGVSLRLHLSRSCLQARRLKYSHGRLELAGRMFECAQVVVLNEICCCCSALAPTLALALLLARRPTRRGPARELGLPSGGRSRPCAGLATSQSASRQQQQQQQ